MFKNILLLLRPQQWLKNAFVFIPIFFGGRIFDVPAFLCTSIAFLSFCFAASSIYCFNDIFDVEHDKKHPTKKYRPIASGAIAKSSAYIVMFFSLLISLGFCGVNFTLNPKGGGIVFLIIIFYYVLNLAYCVKLKHLAIVDVFIIATGFVLRVIVGSFASEVVLSHWIVLMTFLLALFLAFSKRRDDVVMYEGTGFRARPNVNRYSIAFMDQTIGIIASVTMVCYIMYSVSEDVMQRLGTNYLYITSLFVLAGLIRYLQLTIVDKKSGSPTKILIRDHFIHSALLGWGLCFVFIIYF